MSNGTNILTTCISMRHLEHAFPRACARPGASCCSARHCWDAHPPPPSQQPHLPSVTVASLYWQIFARKRFVKGLLSSQHPKPFTDPDSQNNFTGYISYAFFNNLLLLITFQIFFSKTLASRNIYTQSVIETERNRTLL